MKQPKSVKDISRVDEPLAHIELKDQPPLPFPYDNPDNVPEFAPLSDKAREGNVVLDDTVALNLPYPKAKEEQQELVDKFLSGFKKLFSEDDNWTFLQPLVMTMEHCAKCQTCNESCHIYEESGNNELYRPTYRSEIFRRIYYKYVKKASPWIHGDIDLNYKTVLKLIELAFRCNVCRRCAQTCPIGADNALLCREIRKIASQEMGIAAKELHDNGSVLQLQVGSSTGMNSMVVKDNMEFVEEDMADMTGLPEEDCKTPWDVEGADILLIHNAGEIMAWPQNPGCFNVLFNKAGLSWTMSSDVAAYDSINYGVWYDDVMFARTAIVHAKAAAKLGVKKIVLGECGHAHKALTVIADKILTGDLNIPRESCFPILRDIVKSGKIKFDKSRNDFPVTLHDPCNYVRLMGVVEPQREILREIVPEERFREMTPHGVNNYCCGGGSGYAIMSGNNFGDWRHHISGRRKLRQILNAFAPELKKEDAGEENPLYICAPCSNCKGQLRDIIDYYDGFEKYGLYYDGLVELMVNAMVDVKPGFLEFEWH